MQVTVDLNLDDIASEVQRDLDYGDIARDVVDYLDYDHIAASVAEAVRGDLDLDDKANAEEVLALEDRIDELEAALRAIQDAISGYVRKA